VHISAGALNRAGEKGEEKEKEEEEEEEEKEEEDKECVGEERRGVFKGEICRDLKKT